MVACLQLMFWSKERFARFNMFNRFFFDEHGEDQLKEFIGSCKKKTKLAIVLDPPFGGLVTTVGRSKYMTVTNFLSAGHA